jgi:prophage regulatory protein
MAHAVPPVPTVKILRRPEVETRTGLSRSTIYAKINANEFPKGIRLGRRAVGWLESDVASWICERVSFSKTRIERGRKTDPPVRWGPPMKTAVNRTTGNNEKR